MRVIRGGIVELDNGQIIDMLAITAIGATFCYDSKAPEPEYRCYYSLGDGWTLLAKGSDKESVEQKRQEFLNEWITHY